MSGRDYRKRYNEIVSDQEGGLLTNISSAKLSVSSEVDLYCFIHSIILVEQSILKIPVKLSFTCLFQRQPRRREYAMTASFPRHLREDVSPEWH